MSRLRDSEEVLQMLYDILNSLSEEELEDQMTLGYASGLGVAINLIEGDEEVDFVSVH